MSRINVGKVSPIPKGNWIQTNSYEKLNMVNKSGVLYIAKQDVPANTAITNENYWMPATGGLTIGTVETVSASTGASATITQGENSPILNLSIPRGIAGNESIDDSAGAGDTDKVWSADKVNNVLSSKAPAITETASGSIVSIEDGAEGIPVESLTVSIKPVQSGSGDPSPDNVRPISGFDSVKVIRTGKNLFDGNTELYESHLTTTAERLNIYKQTGKFCSGYYTTAWMPNNLYWTVVIPVKASVSYVFSNTADAMSRVIFIDENANIITASNSWIQNYVHTALENEKYVMVGVKISTNDSFQIEIGTTISDREIGSAQTVEVSFSSAGTVYGGTLNVTNGVLTVDRKKLTLSPDMGWSKSTNYPGGYYCAAGTLGLKEYTTFLCSHGKCVNSLSKYVRGTCFCDRSINFRFLGEDSTLQDWQDYLTNNEVSIVGELVTPLTYQLTPAELTTMLGKNHIWADLEDIEVTYRADTNMYIADKIPNKYDIPLLRNGSVMNPSNANAIATYQILPIDFDKDKLIVEYTGDETLADAYAWGYAVFSGATDGMASATAWYDGNVSKYAYNDGATIRIPSPKFVLSTKLLNDYDHIAFTLYRYKDNVVVPLRVDTEQNNLRIKYIEKELTSNYRDADFNETKHNLLYAKHIARNATGSQLTLLHFSDLHGDTVALNRIMSDATDFAFDDAICTGDIVANSSVQIASWWKESVLTCIGNHDTASYNSNTYDWTALSMADRDAYYIAPFESNWDITHTSGLSYYYKDYTSQKVRLIVMDGMLYSTYESDTSLATAQTAWLENLLADAITNDLHVLIAIHAPHGGSTAKECSFSRYGQVNMPTYDDCNTPQAVIDTVASKITSGLKFIGYLVGHAHQDNIWDAEGDGTQLMYCVTCAHTSNSAQWINSDQYRDEENDAYNLVVIDTTHTLIKLIRGGGANIDDHMRSRKAICIDYSTGTIVGEVK